MNADQIFAFLSAPTLWLLGQPPIVSGTILGLVVCATIIVTGLVLAKMRYSPLWAILVLAPVLPVILLWMLAYRAWPVEKTV